MAKKMTKQNQLRHSRAVVKRFLNNPQEDRIRIAHNAITDYFDFGHVCDRCKCDDFGYCGLRRDPISNIDMVTKYCFPTFLDCTNGKEKDVERKYFCNGGG